MWWIETSISRRMVIRWLIRSEVHFRDMNVSAEDPMCHGIGEEKKAYA